MNSKNNGISLSSYESMISLGIPVKPLVYEKKMNIHDLFKYVSDESSDEDSDEVLMKFRN